VPPQSGTLREVLERSREHEEENEDEDEKRN